jgi:hypothetical protein
MAGHEQGAKRPQEPWGEESSLFSTTPLIYPPTSGQDPAGGRRVRGAASKTRLILPSDRGESLQRVDRGP